MEWKLVDGDYIPNGTGGLTALSGGEEVLARERPSARQALAVQYVAEALREEKDLKVEDVELVQTGETGFLSVRLNWQGKPFAAEVAL